MTTTTYAIAIGANRYGRHGSPARAVAAAIALLRPLAASPIVASAPLGPSIRRFANAVVTIDSAESPPALLARLKRIERDFGRRRGRRWGARVLDLDIVLWSGGVWRSAGLHVPHSAYRERAFVLAPLAAIAPGWRDPVTGLTQRQALARLTRRRQMLVRSHAGAGP